jgi:hypothetical protein
MEREGLVMAASPDPARTILFFDVTYHDPSPEDVGRREGASFDPLPVPTNYFAVRAAGIHCSAEKKSLFLATGNLPAPH